MNILFYFSKLNLKGGMFTYVNQLINLSLDDNSFYLLTQNKLSNEFKNILNKNKITIFDEIFEKTKSLDQINNDTINLIKQYEIDLVIFHNIFSIKYLENISSIVPCIAFIHNFNLTCINGLHAFHFPTIKTCSKKLDIFCYFNYFLLRCYWKGKYDTIKSMKKLLKKFNGFIVTSDFMRGLLLKNGVDEELIRKNGLFSTIPESEISSNQLNEEFDILYLGRLVKEKGIDIFLKKYMRKKSKIVIVGDGYYKEKVTKILTTKFKRGNIINWISDKTELIKLYKQSKVVILPSIYPEPFGLVGLEAMALKKPVVAFDVGGISEWLKDGVNGYLIKEGDWSEFISKVNYLINNPQLRLKMGGDGLKMLKEKFTFQCHYQQLIKDIQYFIKKNK